MKSARSGFTLVELLVVVGVIAVLCSLLIPAIGSMQRQGRTAQDVSQLRMLQTAQVAYASENGGQFVEVGLSHGAIADQDIAWINTLEPYTNSGLLLRSPLDWSPHWLEQDSDSGGDSSVDDTPCVYTDRSKLSVAGSMASSTTTET